MKIFLSYTSADRDWALWIGVVLRDAGHEMLVHEWEIGPGENIPEWMERRLGEADKMVGVFSPAYVQAVHSNSERWAAYWKDPGGRNGFLVPIEVTPLADWPIFAKNLRRLSLVGKDETVAALDLVAFFVPPAPPTTKPPFPGGPKTPSTGGAVTIAADTGTSAAIGPTLMPTPPASSFSAGGMALPDEAPAFPRDVAATEDASREPKSKNAAALTNGTLPTAGTAPTAVGGAPSPTGPVVHARNTREDVTPEPSKAPLFHDRETFRRWLIGQPHEVAVALAIRAALRVSPILVDLSPRTKRSKSTLLLPLLRGLAAAWVAVRYPTHAQSISIRDAFHSAANAGDAAAAYSAVAAAADAYAAAAAAASAAEAAYSTATASVAASEAAANAASAADAAAVWEQLADDASFSVLDGSLAALLDRRLWSAGAPPQIEFKRHEFEHALSLRGESWRPWLQWLDNRFVGAPPDEEKDIEFVNLPDSKWEEGTRTVEGVKAVNAEIARRFAEIDERRRLAGGGEAAPELPASPPAEPPGTPEKLPPPSEPVPDPSAAVRFTVRRGVVDIALPAPDRAPSSERAGLYHAEAVRLANALADRLARTDAALGLAGTIEGLLRVLGEDVATVQPDMLRLAAHGVSAAARAYAHPGAEWEVSVESVTSLLQLATVVEDLQKFYPAFLDANAREIRELALSPETAREFKSAVDELTYVVLAAEGMVSDCAAATFDIGRQLSESLPDEGKRIEAEGERVLATANLAGTLARHVSEPAPADAEPPRAAEDVADTQESPKKAPRARSPIARRTNDAAGRPVPSWAEILEATEVRVKTGFPTKVAPAVLDAVTTTIRHSPKSIPALAGAVIGVALAHPILFSVGGLSLSLAWIGWGLWKKRKPKD